MRICFFADGESIHTLRWCSHFAALGHDVHLISFKDVSIENVNTYWIKTGPIRVSGRNWKLLFSFRKVKKLLTEIRPDIFHSHYATSYGITGALCNFHPYVISALGTDLLISPQQSFFYRTLLKFAFSKADWITVMAEHMKRVIERMGVPSAKTSVVPFGIDPNVFNDIHTNLPAGKFVITSTRNFEEIYNLPHLIHAIAKAKEIIPDIRLNLIGSGSLQKQIEDLVIEKGLTEIVTFFGKVSQNKIASILNQSHVFVSVSLSDGNNISLNEAMACGTLCIATNIPANTQWIVDGENGFLVAINDVDELTGKMIASFKNYPELQQKFIPANKKIIEERAIWEKNMSFVEEKYKSLIRK